ncbi:MAG: alpha-glucuronidase family glycosyl hydrolase [Acidobacteriaceae bacterium]
MKRRIFLKLATAATVTPPWALAQNADLIDLRNSVVILSSSAGSRESKAAQVLVEEAAKRCGISWPVENSKKINARVSIYLATRQSVNKLVRRNLVPASMLDGLQSDGFLLRSGQDSDGEWIAVFGADDRGLLFGVGKLLRLIDFAWEQAGVAANQLNLASHPEYKLRGHQLGYRPKTNAYDAWSVEIWDQYIRELAIFGTNAIELIPPRSDDLPDSPHFPLPPDQMMVEMSRIADSYGLDVWIWYPAMDDDYSNPATVASAVKEWARIFAMLPRVDAVFVPGGDPGETEPKYLLALLEKQKKNLCQYHPQAKIWVSPQGFSASWMQEFLGVLRQEHTKEWLDGVVFGPQSRLTVTEMRRAVPQNYPIRCYPDITHSVECQYPVPNWDVAYALTEGREVINPRPVGHANILRRILPESIGFISYSEGCNDDVNKFVWSALAWDSRQTVLDVLRDFAHFFVGTQEAEGFAQGLMHLESNWKGPLATNNSVEVTLERFQDMERNCSPAVLENWRFQQALYRAYFDAFVRRRLLVETAHVQQARDQLARVLEIGWGAVPLGTGDAPATAPPNGLTPDPLLASAQAILEETITRPAAGELRARIGELAAALFQSIRMQLAVERYQGEAVERGTNLDTMETPVSDTTWMRRQILGIRKMSDPMAQIAAIRTLLSRTDPGPGGFYDQLGNVSNRPHLLAGPGGKEDPEFRNSALIGFDYPEALHDTVPMAWKCWAESLFDTPLTLHYPNLDRHRKYRLRVVYSGDEPDKKLRLMANGTIEIHPYMLRVWPPAPQEFAIPSAATSTGELKLEWTREPGLGGNGRGCQVAEVWLIPVSATEPV